MNKQHLIIFLLPISFIYSMEKKVTSEAQQEILKAIVRADQNRCFRPLFELKKRPDIIGTESEQILHQALASHMEQLPSCTPCSSLKEKCAKKYFQSFGIQTDYSKKIPDDLQEYLKGYINNILPPAIQLFIDTVGQQDTHVKKTLADLYGALIKEDEEIIHHLFASIIQEDKLHFLQNAVCITSNWNIIAYLIRDIGLSHIEIETSYVPVPLIEHLFTKAANSGNLALIKKFFIYESFDVSNLRFDLANHIAEGKNLDIILLLKAANVSEKQMAYPHETIMDALLAKRTLECSDHLKKLREKNYRFTFNNDQGFLTILEHALICKAPPAFIEFILYEASLQDANLKTILDIIRENPQFARVSPLIAFPETVR